MYCFTSASHYLPQSRLPTSYQHYSCLSCFSTCWLFPLEFPPSSSRIYRLLRCLQIQSKNSPFLWCKHLWPPAIYIHELLIRHNHVDFCVLKLHYVMLCHVSRWLSLIFCNDFHHSQIDCQSHCGVCSCIVPFIYWSRLKSSRLMLMKYKLLWRWNLGTWET